MRYLLLVLLAGCEAAGVPQTEGTVPNGAEVRLIADVEGCKVYRIQDGGNAHRYLTTVERCRLAGR